MTELATNVVPLRQGPPARTVRIDPPELQINAETALFIALFQTLPKSKRLGVSQWLFRSSFDEGHSNVPLLQASRFVDKLMGVR